MPRDMQLIRKIAFFLDAHDVEVRSDEIEIPGYSQRQISVHCDMMLERKLIIAPRIQPLRIERLSWEGYDFLAAARSDTTWNKVIKRIKEKTMDLAFDTFLAVLKAAGQSELGQVAQWVSQ